MGRTMAVLVGINLVLVMLAAPLTSMPQENWFVYIDQVNGTDSDKCLESNSSFEPCQTLSFVAEKLSSSQVVITVMNPQLDLDTPVEFTGLNYLSLWGNHSTIHCSHTAAGLSFVGIRNLNILSLKLRNCGACRNSTSVDPNTNETECLQVALYILQCTDVVIKNVNISKSNGTGLSMYDTDGTVRIARCNFSDNRIRDSSQLGGGGVHIELTFCSPGTTKNCPNHNGTKDSRYFIVNCTFSNNRAEAPIDRHSVFVPSQTLSVPKVGKGGGLGIAICLDAKNNTFDVANCLFERNEAVIGGGMMVELFNSVQDTTVSVSETVFRENHGTFKSSSGGGLVIALVLYSQSWVWGRVPSNNTFLCEYCWFEGNCAEKGGGVAIFAAKDPTCPCRFSNVSFISSSWTNNISPMGAAMFVTPAIWDYTDKGCLPVPKFLNCKFENNSATQVQSSNGTVNTTSLGYGVLTVTEFQVQFEGSTCFSCNNGSAVHLSNSVVEFLEGSHVVFLNNIAHKGGAIAMYATSCLKFQNNSVFRFTGNRASMSGGAIYAEFNAAFHPEYRNCLIQSTFKRCIRLNTTFTFEGNYAKDIGASIFSTTFKPCGSLCPPSNITSPKTVFQRIAQFNFHDGDLSLGTRPTHFKVATGNSSLQIVPGLEYYLPVTVTDELGTCLNGTSYEAAVNKSTLENVTIDPAFHQVSNNTIKLRGQKNDTAVLCLQASESDVMLSFTIQIADCQPGYVFKGPECVCGVSKYLGLVGCDPKVRLKHGYWIGFCSDESGSGLCASFCPLGFCSYFNMSPSEDYHPLPETLSLLDAYVCGPRRTGRLCGRCAPNHSVHYHSERYTCGGEHWCYLGFAFYLLSEIFPLLLVFGIILYLNIRLTGGNTNCFVLYAQVLGFLFVSDSESLSSSTFIRTCQKFLKLICCSFNLNFFNLEELSFCLWKGANVLDAMVMKATTVGIALVLVVMTILFARCARFRRFSRFQTPQSILIHGLSAFFVLCYSQCAHLAFNILNRVCLYSANFHCEHHVVRIAGYMDYLEGAHVRYTVVAIITLIFMIIIPPLLLLLYPLVFNLLSLCQLSELPLVATLRRLMPFQILDAFQSSFRDKCRFFAGLYFLYRALILAAFAYSDTVFQFYSAVQLGLIIVVALHAIFQPYKRRAHNIIDTLLFTNLAVINGISLFNYTRKDFMGRYSSAMAFNALEIIQAVLVFLPFLCVIIHKAIGWKKRRRSVSDLPSLRSDEQSLLIQNDSLSDH